jgi:precorrin isomerase
LRHAEAGDFPEESFGVVRTHLDAVESFVDEQEERLAEKILHAGGIEPGRVRRTGG